MPQKYTGRVILIVVLTWLALSAIFPGVPASFFWILKGGQQTTYDVNLKPGIDMAGGTSLLYEIKTNSGKAPPPDLSTQMMQALKKRIDPDGVRNLVWRPQGATRLEIQMPLTGKEGQADQIRQQFAGVERELDATNVRVGEVLNAVESTKGTARQAKLDEIAMGSARRRQLFAQLANAWDHLQAARAAHDVAGDVQYDDQYQKLKGQIEDTNLTTADLEAILDMPAADREAKLGDLKKQYATFPARLKAINDFAAGYVNYSKVKGLLDSASDLKRLLKGSGVLEYHILVTDLDTADARAMIERLQKKGPRSQAGDTMRWYEVANMEEMKGSHTFVYGGKNYVLAWTIPGKQMINGPGIARWSLESARAGMDQNGGQDVEFSFDTVGALDCSQLTGANINKPMAIVLDNRVISAPNINSQIGGNGEITGNFSPEEIDYLVSTLNAGSLPAQLADEPISERTVGPQLGADNLRAGLVSCVAGLVIVGIFLIIYYHLCGVVACVALGMNVILILGAMAALNATFTLPAVAGIVLTIGVAVDANVLIFERLREEQERGLSLRMAMRNAYDRAFSAIVDSNVTTAITCIILYWLGTEEVKGFGLTLLIGLISSIFTALFVTKTIFGIWMEYFGLKQLRSLPVTWPAFGKMLHPKFDWMGKIGWFLALSAILLVVGMAAFFQKIKEGKMLDIEFTSGTLVQFELNQPTPIEKVRKQIETADPNAIPSPSVVAVGNDHKVYEVVTPNQNAVAVRNAIINKLGTQLKIALPSKFDFVGGSYEQAFGKAILPVPAEAPLDVNGFKPEQGGNYRGGVAIVLQNLNPPLTPAEIRQRMERQRLAPQAGGNSQAAVADFTVVSPNGDQPTRFALVLGVNPDVPYQDDPDKWRDQVATPLWGLVNESVNAQAQLQRVSNFDAQVAGEASIDALLALFLSIIIIMVYIWIRFGTMKYGTATVVAMIHDTLMVLGFVGLSHYLAGTALGHHLLLDEPFRVNLTLVAGVLTIMSYSMVDTIVVFDRIRENRGKYGVVTRKIINDSVNQTLSRTMLTAGTTMMTVIVMYIAGGPGIHGFTFVLLVGILVGTYSSIAIAAPILLIGAQKQAARESVSLGRTPKLEA
ncbi:MAG TPA: protein translocase subunit SecD [Tepidisphaeraceae bacterium]